MKKFYNVVNSIICCAKEAPHSTVCLRRTKSIKGWFTRQICRQDFVKLTCRTQKKSGLIFFILTSFYSEEYNL